MSPVTTAWVAGTAALTAGWAAVALWGGTWAPGDGSAGPALAAGATALVGAGWRPRSAPSAVPAAAALLALPLAVSAAAGGSVAPLAAVVAALVGGEAVAGLRVGRAHGPWLGLLVAGASALVGAAATGLDTDRLVHDLGLGRGATALPGRDREAGAAAVLGAVAGPCLLLGAGLAPPRPRPLAVPALLVGMASVSQLPGVPAAVVFSVAAVALAAALGPERAGLVLGLLGLAAASVAGALPAAALLASAGALALALDHPAALLLGLPGAAYLAQALVADRLGPVGALVAAATAGAALLVASRARAGAPAWPTPAVLPALSLGLWLLLVPGSWAWAGAHALSRYDRGAVLAAGAGMVAVAVGRATGPGWRRVARDRDAVGERGEGGEGAAANGAGAMVSSSADGDRS